MNSSRIPKNFQNRSGGWWSSLQSNDSKRVEIIEELLDEAQDKELSELVNRFLESYNENVMNMSVTRLNTKMYMLAFHFTDMPTASTLIYLDPLEYRTMNEETLKRQLRRIVARAENS